MKKVIVKYCNIISWLDTRLKLIQENLQGILKKHFLLFFRFFILIFIGKLKVKSKKQ